MKRALRATFFERPTLQVARDLLGMFLVRRIGKKKIALMIMEVEAYDGFRDKASHAYRGRTERTKIMFNPAGTWYVYFTYGMHWMLNMVTDKENYPAAILIRGLDGISGPGRITKFFKVDKKFNGRKANRRNKLWIEDRGVKFKKSEIKCGPRIGVQYAGRVWANKPYRFWIEI